MALLHTQSSPQTEHYSYFSKAVPPQRRKAHDYNLVLSAQVQELES